MVDASEVRPIVEQAVYRALGLPAAGKPAAPSAPAAPAAPKPSADPPKAAAPGVAPKAAPSAAQPATPAAPAAPASVHRNPLVTQEDLRGVAPGSTYVLRPGALVTPSARETALLRRIRLEPAPAGAAEPAAAKTTAPAPLSAAPAAPAKPAAPPAPAPQPAPAADPARTVALGADHGGFDLKEQLKAALAELGFVARDCGTFSKDPVDYPDYAYAVARLVSQGDVGRGIVVDGAGIGSCMVANKVPGVRAALCYDVSSATNAREHNDANVLTLGGQLVGLSLARQIVKVFLQTGFGGDRHARRVAKIAEVESRFLKRS